MADRKVSELPAADALVGTEVVPGAQAGVTKKITVSDIAALATGTGDVVGPASSTDNALARFHETGGKTLQNSAATVSDNGALTLTGATVTASEPILNVTQTWNDGAVTFTGIKADITNTASAAASLLLDLQVGSVSKFSVRNDGYIFLGDTDEYIYRPTNNRVAINVNGISAVFSGNATLLTSTGTLNWLSTTSPSSSIEVALARDAAGTLAQRNATNAQTYRLYNTYTDASNYERLAFNWTTNLAEIKTEAAGTGTLRDLSIGSTGGKLAFLGATPVVRQTHVADADTAHALNATFSDTEVESALNALAGKINSILATLEAFGLHATS